MHSTAYGIAHKTGSRFGASCKVIHHVFKVDIAVPKPPNLSYPDG